MFRIERRYADEMIAHSVLEDPNECCGILAGDGQGVQRRYRIINTGKSPYSYVMDPQEQLDAMLESEREGWEFLAFYHSHTHSAAYPSTTDVRMALQSGWLDPYYVLVSLENKGAPEIRAFRIDESGAIDEEEVQFA